MADPRNHTAREYLRVSRDRTGRQRSVAQQHTDNQRAAEGLAVQLGEPYAEPGAVSASRYSGQTRGGFAELLADLDAGRFGADELWLWESSRGSRRVGEWVALIEACEAAGVRIYVTTHSRAYDPGNGRDRRTLLEDAVDSEYEASKLSARVKRASAERAAGGRPHGAIPYGYRRLYDQHTRVMTAQEPHPEEAPVVAELFERLAAGESLNGITRDYAGRGIRTRTGKQFPHAYLRDIARNPIYIGRRTHRGEQYPAIWPALVDTETFYGVQRVLDGRRRSSDRPGRARYLLSRIGMCDVCDGWIGVTLRSGAPQYQCPAGHVRLSAAALDEYVTVAVVAHLASRDVYRISDSGDGAELATVRGELERVRAELEAADAETPADLHEARTFAALRRGLAEKVAALEEREAGLTVPPALRAYVGPEADVRARWDASSIAARRDVVRAVTAPAALGQLRVQRVGRGRRVPIRERVVWGSVHHAQTDHA